MTETEHDLFAFVLMPFSAEFDDVYRLGIKEPAATLGIKAERVDEQLYRETILDRIYRQIEAADIVIADMTGRNPNVFYEVGYAHAKGKLCVLLTAAAEHIPFDLKHRRHIIYGGSILRLQASIIEELQWARKEIQNTRNSRIKVTLQDSVGNVERNQTETRDEGTAILSVDLVNEFDRVSPDIEGIYFYTTRAWAVSQNGKECAFTASDIPRFERRHFLSSPVPRLQKGAWAQIQFEVEKVLARTWKGEVLKDEYKVGGRSMLRLVTNEGYFDYDLNVHIEFFYLPF